MVAKEHRTEAEVACGMSSQILSALTKQRLHQREALSRPDSLTLPELLVLLAKGEWFPFLHRVEVETLIVLAPFYCNKRLFVVAVLEQAFSDGTC